MLIKWGLAGGIIGAIGAVFTSTPLSSGALFGIVMGVILRKWIFRNLWI